MSVNNPPINWRKVWAQAWTWARTKNAPEEELWGYSNEKRALSWCVNRALEIKWSCGFRARRRNHWRFKSTDRFITEPCYYASDQWEKLCVLSDVADMEGEHDEARKIRVRMMQLDSIMARTRQKEAA